MTFRELLRAEFEPFGNLSEEQLGLLEQHYQLLARWNKRLNLTRITELEEAVRFHYCESLFVGRFLPPGPLKVADLGSGAGFPGIPLAVIRPDVEFVLIESDLRKAVFLREAARNLKNVKVLEKRFQDVSDRFDWIVSRAVSTAEIFPDHLAPNFVLAPNFALLSSSTSAPSDAEVIRLPWGRDRVVIVPRGTVPRGTLSEDV